MEANEEAKRFLEDVHPDKLKALSERMSGPTPTSPSSRLNSQDGLRAYDSSMGSWNRDFSNPENSNSRNSNVGMPTSQSQTSHLRDSATKKKSLKRSLGSSQSSHRHKKKPRTSRSPYEAAVSPSPPQPHLIPGSQTPQRPSVLSMLGGTKLGNNAEQNEQLAREREMLEKERRNLVAEVEQRERQLAEREKQFDDRLQNDISQFTDQIQKTREALIEFAKEQAKHEREAARRKWLDNLRIYGRVEVERAINVNSGMAEMWIDGERFKKLKCDREELDRRRQEVKAEKAAIRKKLHAMEPTENDYELSLDLEILNSYNTKLLAEDKQLHNELQRLSVQKTLHLRETKRIRDEENCKFKDFPVLHDRYVLTQLIGKGGFSEVYKAYDVVTLRYVACKVHQLNPLWGSTRKSNYSRHSIREYNIHRSLSHPRVVQFYDIFEIDNNSFCTVLNHCEGGDLDDFLKRNGTLSPKQVRVIISQVVQGLDYLHSQSKPIIHYDLKPGNILFHNGQIKITDFGLSKQLEDAEAGVTDLTSQGAGTYWYLPPECFEVGNSPVKISPKVDVWSTGVIAFQLLYGKKPFGHEMTQQSIVANNVISRNISVKFPVKPVIPADLQDFILKCLTTNPSLRPSIPELMHHPYIKFSHNSNSRNPMPPPSLASSS